MVQIGPVQICLAQIGLVQIGLVQIGLVQIALVQIGFVQIGPVQIGLVQIGPVQIGLVQIGLIQIGLVQIGPVQVGLDQIDLVQIHVTESGTYVILMISKEIQQMFSIMTTINIYHTYFVNLVDPYLSVPVSVCDVANDDILYVINVVIDKTCHT